MSKNIRKRREKLWIEKEGKCYWCGVDTILPPRGVKRYMPPMNLATLDHLRTRMDGDREEPNSTNEERTVLCCWQCNNIRGVLHQKATQNLKMCAQFISLDDKKKYEDNSDDAIP